MSKMSEEELSEVRERDRLSKEDRHMTSWGGCVVECDVCAADAAACDDRTRLLELADAQSAEISKLQTQLDEIQAWCKSHHNGYDPKAREAMPTLKEPEGIIECLDDLLGEESDLRRAERGEQDRNYVTFEPIYVTPAQQDELVLALNNASCGPIIPMRTVEPPPLAGFKRLADNFRHWSRECEDKPRSVVFWNAATLLQMEIDKCEVYPPLIETVPTPEMIWFRDFLEEFHASAARAVGMDNGKENSNPPSVVETKELREKVNAIAFRFNATVEESWNRRDGVLLKMNHGGSRWTSYGLTWQDISTKSSDEIEMAIDVHNKQARCFYNE